MMLPWRVSGIGSDRTLEMKSWIFLVGFTTDTQNKHQFQLNALGSRRRKAEDLLNVLEVLEFKCDPEGGILFAFLMGLIVPLLSQKRIFFVQSSTLFTLFRWFLQSLDEFITLKYSLLVQRESKLSMIVKELNILNLWVKFMKDKFGLFQAVGFRWSSSKLWFKWTWFLRQNEIFKFSFAKLRLPFVNSPCEFTPYITFRFRTVMLSVHLFCIRLFVVRFRRIIYLGSLGITSNWVEPILGMKWELI